MTNNIFCVTYGGRANNGNTYVPYRAIAHTAEEAIAVINTWKTYGRKTADCIVVNATTAEKIRALFRDGFGTYPSGEPRTYAGFRTTGCGAWDIGFHPALAETIEEHERIYNEQRGAAKAERMRLAEAAKQRRMAELMEQKRGWYHVTMDIEVQVFPRHGNDHITTTTFMGNVIADSGMDAYEKTVQDIHKPLPEMGGCIPTLIDWPDATSRRYEFVFLGVKTDEGYSIDLWNEWKENGEI